jgi:DtxR family Mn-dependent transcriptional regulator
MPKSVLRQQLNLSEAVEDYLKTIYQLRENERREGDEPARVTTNELAAALDVAPGSVTGMMKKLADAGLVIHRPYYGVELTEIGERLALELLRHHRLLELYLTDVVGFGWDEVHEQADALEHAISEELEDRIDRMLGCPRVDPHGDPIPTKEGVLSAPAAVVLSTVAPDPTRELTLLRVMTQAPDLLRYLGTLGLVPGTRLFFECRDPFDGPLHLRVLSEPTLLCQISPMVAGVLWMDVPDGAS